MWYFLYGFLASMAVGTILRVSLGLEIVDKKTGQPFRIY